MNVKKRTGKILRKSQEKKGLLFKQGRVGKRKATKEQIIKLADILDLNKDELLIKKSLTNL